MQSTEETSIPVETETDWFTDLLLAVDTETTGLQVYNPDVQPTFVSWWDHTDAGSGLRVIDNELVGDQLLAKYTKLRCADPAWTKLFFNAKFDIPILRKAGVTVRGPIIDVFPMAQMSMPKQKENDRHGLKDLTRRIFNDPYLEEIAIKKWSRKTGLGIGYAPDHLLFPYGIKDARRTIDLFFYCKTFFDDNNQWSVLFEEMQLLRPLLEMEEIGMQSDPDVVSEMLSTTRERAQKIRARLCKVTNNPTFNPNAPQQCARAIFHGGKGAPTPTRFTKTGQIQCNKLALIESPSRIGDLVLKWRKVAKTTATYLSNFIKLADPHHVIHPTINQNGARTGRISCSDPNLTNLPRPDESSLGRIRACFVPRRGYRFLFADYSQLEIRIQAHWTGEVHIIRAIRAGRDLHDDTCRRILKKDPKDKELRYIAKKLNLAMQYGMGKTKFCDTVLADSDGAIRISLAESSVIVDAFWDGHPKLKEFFEAVSKEVADTGGVVNAYGRFMPVDRRTAYKGVNYKVQSTAADLVKDRMRQLYYGLLKGMKSRMVMQIHDEIMFEIHDTERWLVEPIKELMEEHERFVVPLTVDLEWSAESWAAKRPLVV